MKLDITESNAQTIAQLTQQFPAARIVSENGRTYLVSDAQITPAAPVQQQVQPTIAQPQQKQQKNAFLRMFDAMGDYF